MYRSCALAVALFASVPMVGDLAAQDVWQQQVEDQLIVVGAYLIDAGYTLTHFSTDNALNDDGTFELWMDLEGGVETTIIGVCDEDCSDLDLEVFDSEAASIVSDYELDDFPSVALIPNRSTSFPRARHHGVVRC